MQEAEIVVIRAIQDRGAMMKCVRELMELLGLPTLDPEIIETPRRVVDMLLEFNQELSLAAILKEGFEMPREGAGGMIIQRHIPFRGLCAHHWAPFFGQATLGYIPGKRMVGLSKLARLVQAAGTQRPSTQEVITNVIANILDQVMEPLGVMVVTTASHTCMAVRGINTPGAVTTVSALRGAFVHVPAARQEFLAIAGGNL